MLNSGLLDFTKSINACKVNCPVWFSMASFNNGMSYFKVV